MIEAVEDIEAERQWTRWSRLRLVEPPADSEPEHAQ